MLRRPKGDFEDDFEVPPYPYIYYPPEPPDDIMPAIQAQKKIFEAENELNAELNCPYCGYKLPKGQKHCPICGKDVF